jgi:hypothetical protein
LVSLYQRIVFLKVWQSIRFLFANSKQAVMCLLLRSGFRLASVWPLYHKLVLQRWLSFWKVLQSPKRPLCSWAPSMLQKCFGTLPQICDST